MKTTEQIAEEIRNMLRYMARQVSVEGDEIIIIVEFIAMYQLEDIRKICKKGILIKPYGALLKIILS